MSKNVAKNTLSTRKATLRHTVPALTPEMAAGFARMEYWTRMEAACLLLGHAPHKFDIEPATGGAIAMIYRRIKDAAETGRVRWGFPVMGGDVRIVAAEVVKWAMEEGPEVPKQFRPLADKVPAEQPEKELDPREVTTLLGIIAALANEAHVDIRQPDKAAMVVEAKLRDMGYSKPRQRTILKWFGEVPAALTRIEASSK